MALQSEGEAALSKPSPPRPDAPPLREVIARHGLRARRGLGQHFLFDLNLTARIARAAGDLSATNVVEVGPGPGGLTRALLDAGAPRIVAVERDTRCVEALEELVAAHPGRLEVIEGDALKTDLAELVPAPRRLIANLPYNIAVPLLLRQFDHVREFAGLTVMLQSEVARRLTASPGNRNYGRLSVIVQWLCEVRHEFDIDSRAFVPPPKVSSTLVTLTPRPRPQAVAERKALETVTAAAFGQRRKMLRGSLKSLHLDPAEVGIDPTLRAENLTVKDFCALARTYASHAERGR